MKLRRIAQIRKVDAYKEYIEENILERYERIVFVMGTRRVNHYKRRKYVCTVCGYSTEPSLGDDTRYAILDHIMGEHFQLIGIEEAPLKRRPHYLKPWKDPESLFCDTKFLESLLGKEPARDLECRDGGGQV